MTYGHDMNTVVIPLVQTVFFPKDAVGVKQIERFSARVFPEDLIRHSNSIWLNGRYEIHLDYYGIEGKKLYKNRVDLPLKVEMPKDWQETDENNIDVSIDCRKLDVLAPYVLEFTGRIAVNARPNAAAGCLAMERADADFAAMQAELADNAESDKMQNGENKQPAENQEKAQPKEKYVPDPLVREVLAEYEEQTAAKPFGEKKQKPEPAAEKTAAKADEKPVDKNVKPQAENKHTIKTVADLAADKAKTEAKQDTGAAVAEELSSSASVSGKFGKGFSLSERTFRKNKQKQEETMSAAADAVTVAEVGDVDLKSLKSRTMLKLKKSSAAAEDNAGAKAVAAEMNSNHKKTGTEQALTKALGKAANPQKAEETKASVSAELSETKAHKTANVIDLPIEKPTTNIETAEVAAEVAEQEMSEKTAAVQPVETAAAESESSDLAAAADLAALMADVDEPTDSVEVQAPDLTLPVEGMDFGSFVQDAENPAPIVFTAEQDTIDVGAAADNIAADAADSEENVGDGRIVAASGLAANLKMTNNQSVGFIESLAGLSNEPYYLKYGKVQAGDGETWQRTE